VWLSWSLLCPAHPLGIGEVSPGKTSFSTAPFRTAGTEGELDVGVPVAGVAGLVVADAVGVGDELGVAVTVSVVVTGLVGAVAAGGSSPPNTVAPTAAEPPARTTAAADTRRTVRILMASLPGRYG
jgi:hypothetical protein